MKAATFVVVLGVLGHGACDESGQGAPDTAASAQDSSSAIDAALDTTPPAPAVTCDDILADCLTRSRTCAIGDDGEASCQPCALGSYPARPDGTCTPLSGTRLFHDFGDMTVEAGEEIGNICQSWILDNDDELWVNAVEMKNDGAYHHSNWFFVPENHMEWPTGPWLDCYSQGFHEIDAALAGGVLYAQSTQVRQELQKFQSGAAVRIPPRSRIITVTHLLNYDIEPITTNLSLAIHTIPASDVDKPLTPAQLIYGDLQIPPQSRSYFGSTCDIAKTYANLFGGAALDIKLHYVLPHYHALAAGFDLSIVGGSRDGERIVDLGAYTTDPYGFAFDPPIDMKGATGLQFGCTFDNPRDEVVRWGIGDQEMCEALLFFESPMAFSAGVSQTSSQTTEGDLEVFTGPCGVAGFAFDPRNN